MIKQYLIAASAAILVVASPGLAKAEFPTEGPIRIVTPYGAGGGIDIAARILSSVGEAHLGTRVDVVNMPGAGGLDAASYVHAQDADGYTLIISDYGPLITLPQREDTPYQTEDWAPLVQVTEIAPTFVTRTDSPYGDLESLIAAAKAQPGSIPATHGTYISSNHLPLLRLEQITGARMNHVPTSGGGETVQFLLGGTVPFAVTTPATISGAIDAGTAQVIGVATAERVPSLPDVPTLRESGYDIVMPVWYTIFARADVPEDRRRMLAEKIAEAYASSQAQELAERSRLTVVPIYGEALDTIFSETVDVVRETLANIDQ